MRTLKGTGRGLWTSTLNRFQTARHIELYKTVQFTPVESGRDALGASDGHITRLIYNPQHPSLDATASFLYIYPYPFLCIYPFRSALYHSTSLAIFIIRINLAYNIYQFRRITLYYTTDDSSSRSFSSMLFINIITFFKRLNLRCCLVSGAE